MLDIRIVQYQPSHLDRILAITAEGFRGVSIDYLIEEMYGYIEPGWEERKFSDIRRSVETEPEGVFVAEANGEVVGYITVTLSRTKRLGRIADLAVDARYRRQGVATRLLMHAVSYMREQGMHLAKIETLTNNAAGQAAYPKLGFKEVARQIHYIMKLDD